METIIIESEGQNLEKIKAFLNELNINFKTKVKKEKPYDPEFVKKVLQRSENVKKGNFVEYTPELRRKWFGK